MVDTIKFSEFIDGGDLENNNTTVGLESGSNARFNNPWTFLPPGSTGDRPAPSSAIDYRLRLNTTLESYEYYSPVLAEWIQLQDSIDVQTFPFVIYTAEPLLPNSFNLGSLGDGLLKQSVLAGVATPAIAVNGVDYYAPGSIIPIIYGGTGASTAPGARTNLGLGTMATQNANAVSISGGSANLTSGSVLSAPISGNDITNKNYVDSLVAGLNFLNPAYAASTVNLAGYTYNNGSSGVGATLTAGSNGAFSIDGVSPALNARILIKNQSTSSQNGVYVLTTVGDGSTPAVLTRAPDYNTAAQINPGDYIIITNGATQTNSSWVETAVVNTIGVDPITFSQFTVSIPVPVSQGGTGVTYPLAGTSGNFCKNLIFGGDFDTNPWQRGTSFPAITTGSYCADRWMISGTYSAVVTLQRTLNAPSVAQATYFAQRCLELVVTTNQTVINAGDSLVIMQRIEGYNFLPLAQRVMTLSFWVYSTKTGTYCVALNNSGLDQSYVAEYTITVPSQWQKKTITIPASPSAGTWNYTTGVGLQVVFTIACGTTYQTTANAWQAGEYYAAANQVNGLDAINNIFRIDLIQLEAGNTATPFETRTVGQELRLCQRYCFKSFAQGVTPASSAIVSGAATYRSFAAGLSTSSANATFPVTMRAAPNITFFSPVISGTNWYNNNTTLASGAPSLSNVSDRNVLITNPQVAGDGAAQLLSIHILATSEL